MGAIVGYDPSNANEGSMGGVDINFGKVFYV